MKKGGTIGVVTIMSVVIGYFLLNLDKIKTIDPEFSKFEKEKVQESWEYMEHKDFEGTYRIASIHGQKISGPGAPYNSLTPYIIVSRLNYKEPTIGFFDFGSIHLTAIDDKKFPFVDFLYQIPEGHEYMVHIQLKAHSSFVDDILIGEDFWFHTEEVAFGDRIPIIIFFDNFLPDIANAGPVTLWIIITGEYESIYSFTLNGAEGAINYILTDDIYGQPEAN